MANETLSGVVIESHESLTFEEYCVAIKIEREVIIEMIEYELIQPQGTRPEEWRFDSASLKRGRMAASFYHDLEINLQGIALAFDLLDQIKDLKKQVELLEKIDKIQE